MSRPVLRVLVDAAAGGAWNMAVDEALLETAARQAQPTLRFYRWAPATLSLGYFQPLAHRHEHPPSGACPLVRRASGGGAIVHDREWTYSLAMPGDRLPGQGAIGLYDLVHAALEAALGGWGIVAHRWPGGRSPAARPPFLCFQRRAAGDIVVQGNKVCGSAQRRLRGAVLQHGSLLLARSPAAPELPGLAELAPAGPSESQVLEAWLEELRGRLGLKFAASGLSAEEIDSAGRRTEGKYASSGWTERR
jgi:lipoate-protein ligase A